MESSKTGSYPICLNPAQPASKRSRLNELAGAMIPTRSPGRSGCGLTSEGFSVGSMG
jgi:hypothetical protein